MGNLQNQNTAERKAAESITQDTIMGEVNGVIVPVTTGMGAGTAGLAGDVDLVGTEAQKVISGKRVIGAGLVPKVETVPNAFAAKGSTSNAGPSRECARQVALLKCRLCLATW